MGVSKMLKSKLKVDKTILDNNKDAIKANLKEAKVGIGFLEKVIDKSNWVIDNSKNKLAELVYQLSKFDDLAHIEIEDSEIQFDNLDSMKKLFLIELSEEWDSSIGMTSAIKTMEEVDEIESKIGGNVLEFDESEMRETVIDLFSRKQYYRLRYQLNMLSKFQEMFKKQVVGKAQWRDFKNNKILKEIIGDEAKEYLLTRKDLINLTKVTPNLQDSVIPLLIFEGVSMSKVDNIDEIRYVRHKDVRENSLVIRGNGSDERETREIPLSSEVRDIVKDASLQDYIEKKVRGSIKLVELQESDYILRPTVHSRAKIGKRKDSDPSVLSYRGAYSRVTICKDYIQSLLYDIPFSPRTIATAGKIFYINKYVNEGYGEFEAIKKVLQRFGEWVYEEDGRVGAKNSQQINRLKKVWEIYA